jgi:hypothetical protein
MKFPAPTRPAIGTFARKALEMQREAARDRAGTAAICKKFPAKFSAAGNSPVHQSSVRRNRVTAIVMATTMRATSAAASTCRSASDEPLSMMARTMRT